MMSTCCYARGYQALAYRNFNEVIDTDMHKDYLCFVEYIQQLIFDMPAGLLSGFSRNDSSQPVSCQHVLS